MSTITTFAAIYIGTYESSMKIFELSPRRKVRVIDSLRHRLALGQDTFARGYIGSDKMEELCDLLKEYTEIMRSYGVDDYKAYAGPALQDATNKLFLIDQIKCRTNLNVELLSNSEHRFISYKSIACTDAFDSYTKDGAAVVDIGGGSLQITLFQDGKVITTQHLVLGTLRLKEKLLSHGNSVLHMRRQITELIAKEMEMFHEMFLNDKKIRTVILMGDYCTDIMKKVEKKHGDTAVSMEKFFKYLSKLENKNAEQLSAELDLSNENDPLVIPAIELVRNITTELNPEMVWVPGVNISDGIAYDYAGKHKIFRINHAFEEDVRSAAYSLAKRYHVNLSHTRMMVKISKEIFNATKKLHAYGDREELLLEVAAILHDCGKYVSFVNAPQSSYEIIMASEIIGLSHLEREVVASITKYNVEPLDPFIDLTDKLDEQSYILVAKLSSILQLANALDRSHKQKIKKLKMSLQDKRLVIRMETDKDFLLERTALQFKTEGFEKVFGVTPTVSEKCLY